MNKKLFSAMSRRRVSCPQITQQLWDAIKIIRCQRQVPNVARISRYMSRVHGISEDEVRRQLNHCVRDGLIRLIKRMGFKGSKIGVEQEGYRLPTDTVVKDHHDWYCFECHRGGDVISCTSCHRVYHLACITKEELPEDDVKKKYVCNVCKMRDEKENTFKIKRRQLNHLLGFTCVRLKERLPATITDRQVPSKSSYISDRSVSLAQSQLTQRRSDIKWVTDDGDKWRVSYLIYRPMDLRSMEIKAANNKYRCLGEFQADAQTIVHNVVIYHGVHSTLADMARQMLRDCIYDLQEIQQCRDCYRVSNEKKDKHWFCQPCRPPHQLVYAKQKGFPYWPAKVIKIDGDQYDVRFFGGHHQRALIEKVHIRPISVNIHTLQVKRTSSWNKACEELRKHQELLEKLRVETNNFTTNLDSSDDDSDLESEEEEEDEEVKKPKLAKVEREDSEDDDDDDEDDDEEEPKVKATPDSEGEASQDEESSISSTSKSKVEDGLSQEALVSSSCQEPRTRSILTQTPPRFLKGKLATKDVEKPSKDSKDAIEKMRREFEAEKQRAISAAARALEEHHLAEIKQLTEKHKLAISEIKKKQWCYNCESEAIYHCCWNTAYCSIDCQQLHWQKEHKRVCRRKR
ncbi:zinc finger MYND domain-containing protein 11 isoform X2 [Anabrus simplex]|uniref:zinc finger MYND domain-containing protein 11 isoform X2 n=1 Tax=Anabrus simplex TaxID=316456 RepID=UPI0035A27396